MLERNNSILNKQNNSYYIYFKSFFDFFISLIFFIPISLIIIIFGVLIKLDSKGPMFYTQERVGKNGKVFKIYKLRSMFVNAETTGKSQWAEINDPRITKVGKIIRKVRIDELPQFLNILKGDMALVGPRPERPDLTEKFIHDVPGFEQRLMVKPGITGLAQINGGYDHTPYEKLYFDKKYIENFGIKQDFLILLKTIKVVLTGDGAR